MNRIPPDNLNDMFERELERARYIRLAEIKAQEITLGFTGREIGKETALGVDYAGEERRQIIEETTP